MENFNDMYSNIYITKIEIEPLKSEFLKEFFIVKKDLVIDKIQKMAEAGTLVNPGMPILTIEQNGSYQVSASVPENSISQIKMGAQANIAITSIEKIIPATVTQINPSSQFSGGQYIIKLNINCKYFV